MTLYAFVKIQSNLYPSGSPPSTSAQRNKIRAKFGGDEFCYPGMLQSINIKIYHVPGWSILRERLHSPQWIPMDIERTLLDSSGQLSTEISFITLEVKGTNIILLVWGLLGSISRQGSGFSIQSSVLCFVR